MNKTRCQITGNILLNPAKELSKEESSRILLEVEIFLNGEVSEQIYKKFGAGLRVHLQPKIEVKKGKSIKKKG